MKRISVSGLQVRKLFFFLFVIWLFSSCYYDNVDEIHPAAGLFQTCDTTGLIISYANDIVPILSANCGINNSCHGLNNTSGFNLSNYSELHDQALGGNLVLSITHDPSLDQAHWMPNNCGGCFLNACSILKIEAWVNQGIRQN